MEINDQLSKYQAEYYTENLHDAFEVDCSKNLNKKVLIIDDICTTGSTFEEMIRVLKANGICDIICFATTTPF